MTSLPPQIPTTWTAPITRPRGARLGGFALAIAILPPLLGLLAMSPGLGWFQAVAFVFAGLVMPFLMILASVLGILAVRSRTQPNRGLGIAALGIVGAVLIVLVIDWIAPAAIYLITR